MSKRSKNQAMYRPAKPAQRRPTTSSTPSKKVQTAAAKTNKRPFQPTSRQAVPPKAALPNLLTIRIAAVAVVVAALAGGAFWAVSLHGSYSAVQVAGLILLGFLAGLALVVAIRTAEIMGQVARVMRR